MHHLMDYPLTGNVASGCSLVWHHSNLGGEADLTDTRSRDEGDQRLAESYMQFVKQITTSQLWDKIGRS